MQFVSKLSQFFGLAEEENYMEPSVAPNTHAKTASRKGSNHSTSGSKNNKRETTNRAKMNVQAEPNKQTQKQQALRPQSRVQPTFSQTLEKDSYRTQGKKESNQPQKVVNMTHQTNLNQRVTKESTSKIMIVEPRAYSEAMSIAKHVISGESVLVNFRLLEENQAKRIVDFLTGTVYAEDGDIKRVADEIFLCTPKGIEIDGTAQSLADSHMFDF